MTTQQHRWILCGGLASGKSVVRRMLEVAGVRTIDSDEVGHMVIEPGGPAFEEVARRWPGVVGSNGIERADLAEIVFRDPEELRALEAITHPHIFDKIKARVEDSQGVIVVELPVRGLLGEGWGVVVVDVRDELRMERAVSRGMNVEDIESRLASQPRRAEWLSMADIVIPNHGSLHDLEKSVGRVVPLL